MWNSATNLAMTTVPLAAGIEGFTAVSLEGVESDVPLDRTTEEREETRKFPVPLSEGESPEHITASDVIPRFSTEEGVGRPDYSGLDR